MTTNNTTTLEELAIDLANRWNVKLSESTSTNSDAGIEMLERYPLSVEPVNMSIKYKKSCFNIISPVTMTLSGQRLDKNTYRRYYHPSKEELHIMKDDLKIDISIGVKGVHVALKDSKFTTLAKVIYRGMPQHFFTYGGEIVVLYNSADPMLKIDYNRTEPYNELSVIGLVRKVLGIEDKGFLGIKTVARMVFNHQLSEAEMITAENTGRETDNGYHRYALFTSGHNFVEKETSRQPKKLRDPLADNPTTEWIPTHSTEKTYNAFGLLIKKVEKGSRYTLHSTFDNTEKTYIYSPPGSFKGKQVK